MAKYEASLIGDFDELAKRIDDRIFSESESASREDSSYYQSNGFRCLVRVYERYSVIGENRLSLNMTLIGQGRNLFVSATDLVHTTNVRIDFIPSTDTPFELWMGYDNHNTSLAIPLVVLRWTWESPAFVGGTDGVDYIGKITRYHISPMILKFSPSLNFVC